jgi:diguanylate cyclase (GGDEF)-like protein
VWLIGTTMFLVIVIGAAVSTIPLRSALGHLERAETFGIDLQRQISDYRTTLGSWQLTVDPQLETLRRDRTEIDPTAFASALQVRSIQVTQQDELFPALRAADLYADAARIEQAADRLDTAISGLTPVLTGRPTPSTTIDRIISEERAAYAHLWNATAEIGRRVQSQVLAADARMAGEDLDVGRDLIIGVSGAMALLVLVATVRLGARARKVERALRADTERGAYEYELQLALEMTRDERDVYEVVDAALGQSITDERVEPQLLVAEHSRAHFRRVTYEGERKVDGCGVPSPLDCPAAKRGQTLSFRSSEVLSACPYLRERDGGPCSAVCVPISISGNAVGVLHTTAPNDAPPAGDDTMYLELTARRMSERVAMLRAFATSESQARTDPLTGLMNRRSLDEQVGQLDRTSRVFSVAYADIDHFKQLNDVHGHETGDRALRLFARVLRDSVRPNDIVARYGGEEFVIVLPDCDATGAEIVLERIRTALDLALAAGSVPRFTASFGLAADRGNEFFSEILEAADRALLSAKRQGRDQIVLADDRLAIDLEPAPSNA